MFIAHRSYLVHEASLWISWSCFQCLVGSRHLCSPPLFARPRPSLWVLFVCSPDANLSLFDDRAQWEDSHHVFRNTNCHWYAFSSLRENLDSVWWRRYTWYLLISHFVSLPRHHLCKHWRVSRVLPLSPRMFCKVAYGIVRQALLC